jgi:hypothetical protein
VNTTILYMLITLDTPLYILKDHVVLEAVNLRTKVNSKGGFTISRSSLGTAGEVLFTVDSRSDLRTL